MTMVYPEISVDARHGTTKYAYENSKGDDHVDQGDDRAAHTSSGK